MRELKLQAYDKKAKKMYTEVRGLSFREKDGSIFGVLVADRNGLHAYKPAKSKVKNSDELAGVGDINDIILLQSIDFVDQEGTDVFEDDIIRQVGNSTYELMTDEIYIGRVMWSPDSNSYIVSWSGKSRGSTETLEELSPSEVTVIGNFHTHADLLK